MDLSVVIVSYNTAELLKRCLASVYAHALERMEVFVVDNASHDGSAELVRRSFPQVNLIANVWNAGFGAANNQAIQRSSGRYVAFVNPDCEVQGDSLAGLVAFMDAHPGAAVAGGRLRYGDGSFQHGAFRFPGLAQVVLDFFPINRRLTESSLNGRYPRAWNTRAFEIDHPLGALFCVRRAAIDDVGPFDEAFFMYAEEVDWCYRFKQRGWQVWHCPAALGIHLAGCSTRQDAPAMFVELHRSRLRFFRKHYPLWFSVAARPVVWAGAARLALGAWVAVRCRRSAGRAVDVSVPTYSAYLDVLRL